MERSEAYFDAIDEAANAVLGVPEAAARYATRDRDAIARSVATMFDAPIDEVRRDLAAVVRLFGGEVSQ